jgi:uncharacterized membrane protein
MAGRAPWVAPFALLAPVLGLSFAALLLDERLTAREAISPQLAGTS